MKQLLVASTIFFALQAHAEIFKCKDGKGKIAYQETPCQTKTVGKMGNIPDMSLDDQARAQARANEQKNMVRQMDAAEDAKRQEGETARRQWSENQRNLERNLALEQEAEKKRQEEKKAEARERRRSHSFSCISDGNKGMICN